MTREVVSFRAASATRATQTARAVQNAYTLRSRVLSSRAVLARLLPLSVGVFVLVLWYVGTRDSQAAFVIAPPEGVIAEFAALLGSGALQRHIFTTLTQIVVGFIAGVSLAFVLGYGIARFRLLELTFGPYVVGFQAVPIVAIAPVLIRFFGPGTVTNSIICALIVFFPMLVITMVGIRNVDPDLRALMRSLSASPWQFFIHLEIPAATPALLGGLKVSTTLAVIATVVAEAFGANAGLGFLIYQSRYVYNTSGVLVGVLTLTALALTLYEVVARLERRVLHWQRAGRS